MPQKVLALLQRIDLLASEDCIDLKDARTLVVGRQSRLAFAGKESRRYSAKDTKTTRHQIAATAWLIPDPPALVQAE